MDKCKYCSTDTDGVPGLDKNGHVWIEALRQQICVRWYNYKKEIHINYCPMCGRKLSEDKKSKNCETCDKAWTERANETCD